MKGIVGSTQGSTKYRGGRGRGSAQVGKSGNRDKRFDSRFTDPRFKLSSKLQKKHKQRSSPREKLEDAAGRDPRFAKKFHPSNETPSEDEEDNLTESEGEDISTQPNLVVDEDDSDASASDEMEDKMEDVCEWAPEDVELTEATQRLAVVNCDWDHVRSVDLYAILFDALPLGGQLKEVCVYMSEFGKKMIEHERVHGPDLWVKEGEEDTPEDKDLSHDGIESVRKFDSYMEDGDQASSENSDGDDEEVETGWVYDDPSMLTERGEDGEYFSSGKYRQYEMNRMKYYYAIATFDSSETAAAVYRELDGTDIESSGVVLDLRYVDNEETFEDLVSRADGIPPNFRPLSSFKTAALSQARFRISWDQDDLFRHRSVQDAFTGTTAEDDLAAYLAPPDSDDDEKDARTGRTKAEEKLRLQHKYATLLAEIGKVPGQLDEDDAKEENETRETLNPPSLDTNTDGDTTDDDSLNRFSDVNLDDDAESESNDGESEIMGDMEAKLDLDADSKAVGLQREARVRKMMKESSLGAQAELKYKLRRKEMKKTKKEELLQERERKVEASLAKKKEQTEKLKALIGTDDNGAVRLSGKERRKRHVKEVKETLAKERAEKKQSRIASQMGITWEARARLDTQEADQAKSAIDSRFKSKLLSDPRYHLEITQKDKRISKDVAQLAATVAKARRVKRVPEDREDKTGGEEDANPLDSAVDYFLEPPRRKKKKQSSI
ncbi:unnamed protein product [Phytomonas sp. Hart1]|nr:unnamed protein product [Phytomonas sp. Hart1]|eukprot:CCW70066.1 unnamed protein product [Phytomonas sp. isolate Hart1]